MKAAACVLLVALLAAPPLSHASAPPRSAWWDASWHFRALVQLGANATDPVDGRAVDATGAPVVLEPIDLTTPLLRDARWPTDASGAPADWTFLPSSVRVLVNGTLLPATLLPFDARSSSTFDARSNVVGTLAVQGAHAGDALDVYFDIAQDGPREPGPAAQPLGFAPGVRARLLVPEPPSDASERLVVIPMGDHAGVHASRAGAGVAPESLVEGDARGPTRFDLPAGPYDLDVGLDAPALVAIETDGASGATYPALGGGSVGTAFLAPSLGGADATIDIVGASDAKAHVIVTNGGTPVVTLDLGRLAVGSVTVPAGATFRVDATSPVVVLSRGSRSLSAGVPIAGGSSVLVAERQDVHAVVSVTAANAQAFPMAQPQEALSGRVGDPPRLAWSTTSGATASAEPWAFVSPTGSSVTTGSMGALAVVASVGSDATVPFPPGADGTTALAGSVEAPFPDTSVRVVTRGLDGSSLDDSTTTLSRGGSLGTTPDGRAALARDASVLLVNATRPVAVFVARPGTAGSFFAPTLAPLVAPTSITVEFQGPRLAWSQALVAATARPGDRAHVAVALTNLGRGSDGSPLTEDVTLSLAPSASASSCNASWDTSLAVTSLPGLVSPSTRTVDVLVDVPAGANDGDCATVQVSARGSHGSVSAVATVTLRARSTFQPQLRVIDDQGEASTEASVTLDAGVERVLRLELTNVGARNGSARVSLTPAPGYDVALDANASIPLDAGATKDITLRVRAPTGGEPAWDVIVEAAGVDDATARDQVIVSLRPRANVSLGLEVAPGVVFVTPGGRVNATARVTNTGASTQEVSIRGAGALPDGWQLQVDPPRVVLAPGASATANVTIQAPSNATVASSLPVVLVARPTLLDASAGEASAGIVATVANDFALDATLPETIVAAPRDSGEEAVDVVSHAAAPMRLTLRASSAPAGWSVALRGLPLDLAPGERATLRLAYAVGARSPARDENVSLVVQLADATSPPRLISWSLPVFTQSASVLRFEGLPASVTAPIGRPVKVSFRVVNDGNAEATDPPALTGPGRVAWGSPAPWAPGQIVASILTVNASENATVTIGPEEIQVVATPLALVVEDARLVAPGALAVTIADPSDAPAEPSLLRVLDARGLVVATVDLPEVAARANLTRIVLVPSEAGALTAMLANGATRQVATPSAMPAATGSSAASAAQRIVPAPSWVLSVAAALLVWRRRA